MPEDLLDRLIRLSKQFNDVEKLKSKLILKDGTFFIEGTDLTFSSQEITDFIDETGTSNKIAQSDVPDNMLALLTALKAVR